MENVWNTKEITTNKEMTTNNEEKEGNRRLKKHLGDKIRYENFTL